MQGSYVSWQWRIMQKRNRPFSSKLTGGISRILTQALENFENLQFNGLLLTKVHNAWAKKVQRSYVLWHWSLMQNLKENWLVASKITWVIWQIFTRALKVSKVGLWCNAFIQSRKYMSLKFTGELRVMAMKSDAKFEGELTWQLKIDLRNLINFDQSTQKSQKFAF